MKALLMGSKSFAGSKGIDLYVNWFSVSVSLGKMQMV